MDKQGAGTFRGIIWLIVLLIFIAIGYSCYTKLRSVDLYAYNLTDFKQDLEEGEVSSVIISQNEEIPTGSVKVSLDDGGNQSFYVSDVNEIIQLVDEKNAETAAETVGDEAEEVSPVIEVAINDVARQGILLQFLPYVILIIVMVGFMFIIMGSLQNTNSGGRMLDFGKIQVKLMQDKEHGIDFTKVAGLEEEKQELEEIVDFLKSPAKYTKLGARIPKGVLLVGPPGTGKTLMAEAVSGEAKVRFLSISGSDFVEMFVGVGASRVRDLFTEAKKCAPCIVFIDEIDAVARKRGSGLGGGHDEREQTLNQLLVEMDGFGTNEGIIVMAATNRVDILDPAILRPGLCDRRVVV